MITVLHLDRKPFLSNPKHSSAFATQEDFNKHRDLYADITMGFSETRLQDAIKVALDKFSAYEKVVTLNADMSLDDVFCATNTINDYWCDKLVADGISHELFRDENRSTSVGDLIVMRGEVFAIAACGFTKLNDELAQKAKDLVAK